MLKEQAKCETCHVLFVKNRRDQRFCKPQCADRARKLRLRYSTTPAIIHSIYKQQSGRCAICDTEGDIYELGFQTRIPLCIDHSHTSGEVRGLLCGHCNKGIGLLKDNRNILKQAIKYLTKHTTRDHKNETNETSKNKKS